jgi:hypothetical protein
MRSLAQALALMLVPLSALAVDPDVTFDLVFLGGPRTRVPADPPADAFGCYEILTTAEAHRKLLIPYQIELTGVLLEDEVRAAGGDLSGERDWVPTEAYGMRPNERMYGSSGVLVFWEYMEPDVFWLVFAGHSLGGVEALLQRSTTEIEGACQALTDVVADNAVRAQLPDDDGGGVVLDARTEVAVTHSLSAITASVSCSVMESAQPQQ